MRDQSKTALMVGVGLALTLVFTACSTGSSPSSLGTAPATLSGSISLWSYFVDREASEVQHAVDGFEKAHPGVTVTLHNGQDDEKISKVIATGSDVDVAIFNGVDNLGSMCSSGSLVDLAPYMDRDHVATSSYTSGMLTSSSYNGSQCSLPFTGDTYGLYYNTALLTAAGVSAPPKTLDELQTTALKLTTYNPDGSIKTLGFNPLIGSYESLSAQWSFASDATWMKGGKSAISDGTNWSTLMQWQKKFVDAVGYDKLKAFTAGMGDEWSANQAFQTGQVAMMLDGEWRVKFIADQAASLEYATAPFPTTTGNTENYGGGYSNVSPIAVANNSKSKELAWALVQYLTHDPAAQLQLASSLGNIPASAQVLSDSSLRSDPHFATFLDIANSGKLTSIPPTVIGTQAQTIMDTYWQSYQSGSGGNLTTGLTQVDTDINQALTLSTGQ